MDIGIWSLVSWSCSSICKTWIDVDTTCNAILYSWVYIILDGSIIFYMLEHYVLPRNRGYNPIVWPGYMNCWNVWGQASMHIAYYIFKNSATCTGLTGIFVKGCFVSWPLSRTVFIVLEVNQCCAVQMQVFYAASYLCQLCIHEFLMTNWREIFTIIFFSKSK